MSGMPSINIQFTELAATLVERSDSGIIAMILKEATVPDTNPVIIASAEDIPATLSASSKKQIGLALLGYINAPKKVIAYFIPATVIPTGETDPVNNTDYTDALNYFKTVSWDYLVVPTVATDAQTTTIVNYIKSERAADHLVKAVLPNTSADSEAIINYTTAAAIEGENTYTAEQYCARIAGMIAGTPIEMSTTYATLPELTDCSRLTKVEMDAAVDAGKFFLWWDGEKVKTSRAVNSLTTLTSSKNRQFQKIKVVSAVDTISFDIKKMIQDTYIGKVPNNYDNKQILMTAISGYFDEILIDGVINRYTINIDINANRAYLNARGVDTSAMTDDEIKQADTGTNVFLVATLGMLDVIEDVTLNITI